MSLMVAAGAVGPQAEAARPGAAPSCIQTTVAVSALAGMITASQQAEDAATQALIDEILKIPLAGGYPLATPLAFVPQAEIRLRERIVQRRQLRPAAATAGKDAVEAFIERETLVGLLRELFAEFLPKAPPGDLEPAPAAGQRVFQAIAGPPDERCDGAPPGWRHCCEADREAIVRAAAADLRENLMERLGTWRVTTDISIADLWTAYPGFREAVERMVGRLPLPEANFERNGLCVIALTLPRVEVVSLLKEAAADCPDPPPGDLARAVDPESPEAISTRGLAVAPPRIRSASNATVPPLPIAVQPPRPGPPARTPPRPPEWVNQTLRIRVTGTASGNEADAGRRRERAVATARTEARRQLWLRIEGLRLPDGRPLSDVLPAAPAAVETIEQAIRPESPPTYDDRTRQASITLSVRLEEVWAAVRDLDTGAGR